MAMYPEYSERRALPFYMTHPGHAAFGSAGRHEGFEFPGRIGLADNFALYDTSWDNSVLRDMEYLQETYPVQVRKFSRRVAEILDKMDYDGSVIYDEYPDRYSLQRLAGNIVEILQREEQEALEGGAEECLPPHRWKDLGGLMQVLVCNEICKRRHNRRRVSRQFYF